METRYCQVGVEHVYEPDNHFCCKLQYIRENGGLQVGYGTDGKAGFHGPTIRERANRQVAQARAAGLDPVNVGNRWV